MSTDLPGAQQPRDGQGLPDGQELAARGLSWLLEAARDTGTGLAWAGTADGAETDPTLYGGAAGIVITLLEAHRHFGDDRYADAALRASAAIAAAIDVESHCSLYFGLTGMAWALRAVSDLLGDPAAGAAADRALAVVASRFDGERWSDQFELLGGNAGIALGALAAGDPGLAVTAVTPYLRTAEPTAGGVHWEVRAGMPARFHHISHGTLGIAMALAAVGRATGRRDLVDLALAGAADVVSRNEAGPAGFLVPHSDPQHRPELVERYSFGWCHGPAGDAQVFRLLSEVTGDAAWRALADRCWQTVTSSGLPRRLRPGFWDNSGRCCGTAGVLALACDRYEEHSPAGPSYAGQRHGERSSHGERSHGERSNDLTFAAGLAGDIAARATEDRAGARWSHEEYRVSPSALEPRTGWAMGNAGIVRELLRFARIRAGTDPSYAVAWPDHPPAGGRP